MARMPRLTVAGQPHLVVQRCVESSSAFCDDADRSAYLAALRELALGGSVAIHAYALLDDAVMLLVTPRVPEDLGRFMQRLNRRYVPAFRQCHGGSGALWSGRFQAAAIEPERHLFPCTLMIEQAPIKAGLVATPAEWPWSSASHHLGLAACDWMREHPAWWRLGNTPFEREARHDVELRSMLCDDEVAKLLDAARTGWPLGSPAFLAAIAEAEHRRAEPRRRGRPRRDSPTG